MWSVGLLVAAALFLDAWRSDGPQSTLWLLGAWIAIASAVWLGVLAFLIGRLFGVGGQTRLGGGGRSPVRIHQMVRRSRPGRMR